MTEYEEETLEDIIDNKKSEVLNKLSEQDKKAATELQSDRRVSSRAEFLSAFDKLMPSIGSISVIEMTSLENLVKEIKTAEQELDELESDPELEDGKDKAMWRPVALRIVGFMDSFLIPYVACYKRAEEFEKLLRSGKTLIEDMTTEELAKARMDGVLDYAKLRDAQMERQVDKRDAQFKETLTLILDRVIPERKNEDNGEKTKLKISDFPEEDVKKVRDGFQKAVDEGKKVGQTASGLKRNYDSKLVDIIRAEYDEEYNLI